MFKEYTIENDKIRLSVLNLGSSITEFYLKESEQEITLRYEQDEQYIENPVSLNSVIGPHAGRIKGASYQNELGQEVMMEANDGENNLHSGQDGLMFQYFEGEKIADDRLKMHLNHGDVFYEILYHLEGSELVIDMHAYPRKEQTLLNLTQHTYFNLSDDEDISKHYILSRAHVVQALDDEGVEKDELIDVRDRTVFDFQQWRPVSEILNAYDKQFDYSKNIDHSFHSNYVALYHPETKIQLEVISDSTVSVVYFGNFFKETGPYANKKDDRDHLAIAIEPQDLPNDVNIQSGPSQFYHPGRVFLRRIRYRIEEGVDFAD